jgi:hypothetical protein
MVLRNSRGFNSISTNSNSDNRGSGFSSLPSNTQQLFFFSPAIGAGKFI